jgi:multicomponent K+:H+ antiporter subunit G
MTDAGTTADLPLWAALLVSFFVLAGAAITLVGALGLVRFKSFYERVHAPTLGASLGTVGVLVASMLFFSVTGGRVFVHEALIFVFITLTTPVTLMLLTRSALYRDRTEGNEDLPDVRSVEDG